jgi:hypothetical protein
MFYFYSMNLIDDMDRRSVVKDVPKLMKLGQDQSSFRFVTFVYLHFQSRPK